MCNNDSITELAKKKLIFASATTHAVQIAGQYDSCKIEQRARELLCDIVNTRMPLLGRTSVCLQDRNQGKLSK